MNLKHIKAVVLSLLMVVSSAQATLITHDSRHIADPYNEDIPLDAWYALTSNIDSQVITEFVNVKTGQNKFNFLTIDFTMDFDGTWNLDAGLDAGYGASLYLDGLAVLQRTDDLWWSSNWNNSDVMSTSFDLSAGDHTIALLWAEGCCNGASSIRFSDNGGNDFSMLSVDNVNLATVPEPTSLALFGLALFGLALRRNT